MSTTITHDNHVHTCYCGHSGHTLPLTAYRDAAAERGLIISLREHAPLPEEYLEAGPPAGFSKQLGFSGADCTMDGADVVKLIADAARLGISLGFEVDILPGFLGATERLIAGLRRRGEQAGITIDAFNASHHMYHGCPWDADIVVLRQMFAETGVARFIREYFGAIREAARSGLFGCISHIDGPLRFAADPGELLGNDGLKLYRDEMLMTLATLAESGVALEYNTAGLRHPLGYPQLLRPHLDAAARLAIPVVVGSDAHRPDQLGLGFALAASELRAAGLSRVHRFVDGALTPADELPPDGDAQ